MMRRLMQRLQAFHDSRRYREGRRGNLLDATLTAVLGWPHEPPMEGYDVLRCGPARPVGIHARIWRGVLRFLFMMGANV